MDGPRMEEGWCLIALAILLPGDVATTFTVVLGGRARAARQRLLTWSSAVNAGFLVPGQFLHPHRDLVGILQAMATPIETRTHARSETLPNLPSESGPGFANSSSFNYRAHDIEA